MGATIYIRDVDPETKEKLEASARAAGQSLSAYLRDKLNELAKKPKRRAGWLSHLGPVGEPLDGWGPLPEEDLRLWEGYGDGEDLRD